ncbi:MAG: MFS transporter [Candidatus Microthrix parvicella]|jgi:branched-chain amino acid transport system ATP-binding protein
MSVEQPVGWGSLLLESSRTVVQPSHWWPSIRHPIEALRRAVGDGPLMALVVLFGLNAVDELDRTGFGILIPNIRDDLGLSNAGILSLVAISLLIAFLLQLPIAVAADRYPRVPIAIAGAIAWGVFSLFTGLANGALMLVIARSGAGIGRAVVDPTHNSLLADYYAVDRRSSVYSIHRGANVLGQFAGPLLAGGLAAATGSWRTPFFVFVIPTVVFAALALRLREPVRGGQERKAAGGDEAMIALAEPQASFEEAFRLCNEIPSLRRLWYSVPFLSVSLIGFVSLAGILYEQTYNLDELQRGYLAAAVEPFQFVGLAVGAAMGTKLFMRDPSLVFKFLRVVAIVSGVFALAFALAPTVWLTVVANIALTSCLAIILPGLLASLSVAIPARARAVGFAIASYWAIPGLLVLPLIGWLTDRYSARVGMLVMVPVLVVGGLIVSTAASTIQGDIADVWTGSLARAEDARERAEGRAKLLVVRDLHVSYDNLRVLTGLSMEVGEGEVVALLGTNGAGKSTLLGAIAGTVHAGRGAVIFDGRDITHAPPQAIAHLGLGEMPGGKGTFPSLTVAENLRTAGWMLRSDPHNLKRRIEEVCAPFPVLADRMAEPAANLSGGQQQQLALAMALLARPRLLMIDELSLGLAPVVVEDLVSLVRQVAASGTTVIVVEQSVNVALTLADRALFMEKGKLRFTGPTAELLERPDLLRSVFLGEGPTHSTGDRPSSAPMPDSPVLQASNLVCAFGGVRAVDGVSLEVRPREIVGLIGPNGAGKTTVLDAISGFVPTQSGTIGLGNVELTNLSVASRAKAGLGRSFQDARLFPGLTVTEALALAHERWVEVRSTADAVLRTPPLVLSEWKVRRDTDELIERFGLGDYRDKFVGELSTGSRRIVDLAAVVAQRPSVVMLDEPSSGIAQRETEALGPLLLRLRDELECAMVIVEHDMGLLSSVADRLVALETGRVITSGPPDEVLSHPEVVASYLGGSPEVVARSGRRVADIEPEGAS